jgi:hypothetical protein
MTRTLILTASLFLAAAVAVSAQHPQSHPQGRPHGPHHPMDPALHAALHALVHGDWHGTVKASGGDASSVDLKVTTDKAGQLTFRLIGGKPAQLGASSNFALEGQSLRWTQEVSGKPCQVTATVTAPKAKDPQTLTGTMSCTDGERALALRKTNQ